MMSKGYLPITLAELSDIEKGAIILKGGDPEKQEDIDIFFKLCGSTRGKWKQAYVYGLE